MARPLTNEQRDQVEANLPLVKWVVGRLWERSDIRRIGDLDDVLQVATLALMRAVRTHVPGKGAALGTWATNIIRHDVVRAAKQAKPLLQLDGEGSLDTPAPKQSDPVELAEQVARMRAALDQLPSKQRGILVGRFLDGEPLGTIAERFGMWECGVSRSIRVNLARLRSRLEVAS